MSDAKSPVSLVELLGAKLVRRGDEGDEEIDVAELAQTKKTVVLYFSAHWCPPCRGFTPLLSSAYAEYKKSATDDNGFEMIFVSSDRDVESFREYHAEMSFPALPYEARDLKAGLSKRYGVEGIPHLVAVDVATGEKSPANEAAGDLRSFVAQHGAAAFPLTSSHVDEMKAEAKKKQADALEKLSSSTIVVTMPRDGTAEKNATLGELLGLHEYIGLVFGDGDKDDATYSKILDAAKAIGEDNFFPIYVGWTSYRPDHQALWERFASVREDGPSQGTRHLLGDVAGEDLECLAMVTIKSRGSGLCSLDGKCEPSGVPVIMSVDKGLGVLRQFGPSAFPWDEAAVKDARLANERRVNGLRDRLAGFDFLKMQSSGGSSGSLLVRGIASNKNPLEKKCLSVDDILAPKGSDDDDSAVLGLYFSAHWCPPCRAFTPELLKVYEEVRAKNGSNSFEVLFVSFDRDSNDFEEYYSSMVTPTTKEQWLSLEYGKSRELANDLTEVFGVEGFPTLVLLKRDGTILSDDARGSVSKYGAGSFPWDSEGIQRAKVQTI